ncbi:MAG: hypothetical protein JNK05_18305 [Myxococcales bacterium]|nr:hypothetical protein [Myxococcales bacterium]
MAEEKKPNLKDRLKKTQVGMQNPAAPAAAPAPGAPVAPPGADLVAPPMAAPVGGIQGPSIPAPSMPAIPGIPGLGGDVAPPPFVAEQQAAQAAAAKAAARAKAAADDPFGASTAVPAGPQEVRIVVDERPVDDKEVGRSRTGLFVGIAASLALGIGIGAAIGIQTEVSSQGRQTLSALNGVREKAQAAGNVLATVKTKIEHACERANIAASDEPQGGPAQPAGHPPEFDADLVTWFRQEGGENPPFGPDVFAARMGRLDPNVSQKIAAVHVLFTQLWGDLRRHSETTGTGDAVRESLRAAADNNAMTLKLGMIFKQAQANAWVGVLTLAQNVDLRTGAVTLAPLAGIPEPTRPRAIFTGLQPLATAQLPNTFVSVNVADGLGPSLQRSSAMAWLQYRERLQALRRTVQSLDQAHQGLMTKLSGRR